VIRRDAFGFNEFFNLMCSDALVRNNKNGLILVDCIIGRWGHTKSRTLAALSLTNGRAIGGILLEAGMSGMGAGYLTR
jgi:hypothetical protein